MRYDRTNRALASDQMIYISTFRFVPSKSVETLAKQNEKVTRAMIRKYTKLENRIRFDSDNLVTKFPIVLGRCYVACGCYAERFRDVWYKRKHSTIKRGRVGILNQQSNK